MAQRLATEYVKTRLQLTEAEMSKFIQMFTEQQVTLQVKVLDKGRQEIVFLDDAGQEVVLSFEQIAGQYICRDTYRFTSIRLANIMRKAIAEFKGAAVSKRIFRDFTMVYYYQQGKVIQIKEVKDGNERVVFEHKDTLGQLELLYQKNEIEHEIQMIYEEINRLLDLRIHVRENEIHTKIDNQLKELTHRLFVLEA
ncbi:hypothetical protein [Paenibacillus larvae]|uniref:Non-ribosomal peptide synthetase module n=1 Tax=Paenibacillus larvae subsp. larvae DSM 25430 TaxID=697284 RepID=V9W9R9_9BACL|nr:hypothetical protein [Paenibacillus larvae]AHD06639.1 hypothetical protein ERIC2_c28550 [Paenibacillus larvae subsp. larvae DSM 25430]AVG13196.1 hypothetical protein ERICII_02851 [Paenibacillus larvae subsp. larvae DSM 25430]MDR5568811.1 non-ribosomal peptide synthetase module [Paenibacillus larvae]MDR5596916.1 non-ribosomal peptide synthetase module [Paenibacillus larvae]